jgi:hypothetical protein
MVTWLGTSFEVDGGKKSGWVLASNAAPTAQSPKQSAEAGGADTKRKQLPQASHKSFSCEPARELIDRGLPFDNAPTHVAAAIEPCERMDRRVGRYRMAALSTPHPGAFRPAVEAAL